jgi:aminopeptidase
VETSVNGTIAFNYPTSFRGREVREARLEFQDGVVVEATATIGEDYLISQLDTDDGARRVGEFAIGTNENIRQFTGNTLLDEKISGTIHLALGNSYPETGGQNRSVLHWDMVHNMRNGGTIAADGEVFYRDGKFLML